MACKNPKNGLKVSKNDLRSPIKFFAKQFKIILQIIVKLTRKSPLSKDNSIKNILDLKKLKTYIKSAFCIK